VKIKAKLWSWGVSSVWAGVLGLSLAAAIAAPKPSQGQGAAPAPAPSPNPATSPAAQTPAPTVKTAEQEFMNVQVLTDIPADQLVPAMEFMSASLGVRCNFCHVNPFQNDDKREKNTARDMIKLELAINKMPPFNGRMGVTCYTCHLGSPHPTSVPAIPEPGAAPTMESMMGGEGGEHQMPMGPGGPGGAGAPGAPGTNGPGQAQPTYPTVNEILDKWTQALGGADAIAKLKSLDAKGTVESEGSSGMPIEVVEEAPNKQFVSSQTKNGSMTMGFDGTAGWQQDPSGKVRDIEGIQLEQTKRSADLLRLLDIRNHYSQIRLMGVAQVTGHNTYMVAGIPAGGGPPERMYFDQNSGLLLRYQFIVRTPLGNYPFETDFSDYKMTGGVNLAFTVRQAQPSQSETDHFTDIEVNATVDDSKFQKPAPPPGTAPPTTQE